MPTPELAREALKKGEVDLLFGDGISLAFWLNGTDSQNCCLFRGGPFTERSVPFVFHCSSVVAVTPAWMAFTLILRDDSS